MERWKPVPGFDGYEVSDLGRVRSCYTRERVLRGSTSAAGYIYISLRRAGVTHRRTAHRLVMDAFVGPCPAGMEIRHFPDNDRSNNALSNLSYGSRSQNACDRHIHGTMSLAKLTEEQVEFIKRTPPGTRGLCRLLGVTRHAIRHARLGLTWKHVVVETAVNAAQKESA